MPALLLTVASAVLYGLAFPPTRLWPLAWVALVPLLRAVEDQSVGRAAALGWVWMMALSLTVIPWFGADAAAYFGQSPLVGIGLFLAVPTITGALDYMAFAVACRWAGGLGAVVRPLVIAATWVAAELGRTRLFGGNPWELLAYSQLGAGPLGQIADVTGMYGPSFVVATVNGGIATALAERRAAPGKHGRILAPLAAAAVVAAVAFLGGEVRLAMERAQESDPSMHRIAIVQAHVDIGTQWREGLYGKNLELYLRLTDEAIQSSAPRVVFWPENAMTFFLSRDAGYRTEIGRVLSKGDTDLVAGGVEQIGSERDGYYNSAFLVHPDGTIAGRYDKQHLIPFAERFPVFRTEALLRRFGRIREFTSGGHTDPLKTRVGAAGVVICNEGLLGEPARNHVRDGAEYLVILANDGWTEAPAYGLTAVEYARMRAIEQRRWVVRSSTSGPSAIVDPRGRLTAISEAYRQTVLAGVVGARRNLTPYARLGDWFAWACVALAAASVVASVRRRRRAC